MSRATIRITGARQHNLKNITVELPKNSLTVITGVSGSGKSSLAFDTLYAEGQRRYVESLSAHAQQVLGRMEKPDVDQIEGLSPAIAIEQHTAAANPRSTVATATEIYDYLRVLYATCGQPHDPETGEPILRHTTQDIAAQLLAMPEGTRLMICAPLPATELTAGPKKLFERLQRQGFVRLRVNGDVIELENPPELPDLEDLRMELVVDRLVIRPDVRVRLTDSLTVALRWSGALSQVLALESEGSGWKEHLFTTLYMNPRTGFRLPALTPKHFSFNSHLGACPQCEGLGTEMHCDPELLVPDRDKSIADGAIRTWWAKNPKLKAVQDRQIDALVAHFGIDPKVPFRQLPDDFRHALFHGTGKDPVKTGWKTSGTVRSVAKPYEGLVEQARRLHENSESEFVKLNVRRFMNPAPCTACRGRRLRPELLAVTLRTGFFSKYENDTTANAGSPRETSRNDDRGNPETVRQKPSDTHRGGSEGERVPATSTSLPIDHLTALTVAAARRAIHGLELTEQQRVICTEVLREMDSRLGFLENVGLGYLTLDRENGTLSGGEAQRIRLAQQLGSRLSGVLYVLDEPSIGLHQRDNDRLLATLRELRDLGNTVVVVEHDEDTIAAADWIIDLGPGAGPRGGKVIGIGPPNVVRDEEHSITGQFMSGRAKISVPKRRVAPREDDLFKRAAATQTAVPLAGSRGRAKHVPNAMRAPAAAEGRDGWLTVHGAEENNLQNIDAAFPLGCLVCVTGVSGSGKSTLVDDILRREIMRRLYQAKDPPGKHRAISGLHQLDKAIVIDQSPIGRSPRSNPATYTDAFKLIRDLFAQLPAAKVRGYTPGTFSFNTAGGRCEACEGDGQLRIDMHFLSDVFVTCEACEGKRYNREVLEVTYKGRNIAEVLNMSLDEAADFFRTIPGLSDKLRTMCSVGLGYLKLGQGANTLSGGEAQRIKLSAELSKKNTGRTLYLLDEPTTGLHFADIETLLRVFFSLRDQGNTLIVIEHNLDVIKCADWILDLGPEGGSGGGRILAEGTPEQIAAHPESITGRYLRGKL